MELNLSGELSGTVIVPPSKSAAHRLLICAALADAPSQFFCGEYGDDVEATADCLRDLGAVIKYSEGEFRVWPIGSVQRHCQLDCGESGSTLRFLLPVAAALGADASFTGRGRLSQRPLSPLYEELTRHGVALSPDGIFPLSCKGQLQGGEYTLDAGVSSQFITGLLLALPLAHEDSTITLTGTVQSRPYIDLTLNTLIHSGVRIDQTENGFFVPGHQRYSAVKGISIEGDWSAAAFWTVAGVIGKSPLYCKGIDFERSLQGDKAIVAILKDMGGQVRSTGDGIAAFPSELQGTDIDCTDIPDLVPALAAAAAFAKGRTTFHGTQRLRLKESDRVQSIAVMLAAFGIECETAQDTLTVIGGNPRAAAKVETAGDHRIAMAASIIASACEGTTVITDAECVSKSYPDFFNDFRKAGGSIA